MQTPVSIGRTNPCYRFCISPSCANKRLCNYFVGNPRIEETVTILITFFYPIARFFFFLSLFLDVVMFARILFHHFSFRRKFFVPFRFDCLIAKDGQWKIESVWWHLGKNSTLSTVFIYRILLLCKFSSNNVKHIYI